jgi:nicotinamide-nucleotide amidase
MMDWTDKHCRYFFRLLSTCTQLYTEMITSKAILRGDKSRLLDYNSSEHPLVLQLGGSLAHAITCIPGASSYFDCGFITYSNQSKVEMLGVNIKTLETYGAVSEEVAREMVIRVITKSHSDVAVSITGVAGPTGGTLEKPIGMVCFGFSCEGKTSTKTQRFSGDRANIVSQSVSYALRQLSLKF